LLPFLGIDLLLLLLKLLFVLRAHVGGTGFAPAASESGENN